MSGLEFAPLDRGDAGSDPTILIVLPGTRDSLEVSGRTGEVLRHLPLAGLQVSHSLHARQTSDLDADGVRDLLIAEVHTRGDRSRVVAYSGRDGKVLRTWKQREDWPFGSVFDVIGDVDGDGTPDLLVTAPDSSADVSWAWILSGKEDRVIHQVSARPRTSSYFGVAGCGIGDVDGDSVSDFLIGDASCRAGASLPGFVRLYSGKTGLRLACWGQEDVCSSRR